MMDVLLVMEQKFGNIYSGSNGLRKHGLCIYHFTDGEPMTWYGFALKILEENGLKSTTKIVKGKNYQTLAKRPKYSIL